MIEPRVSASEVGKVVWCPHAASLIARGSKQSKEAERRTASGTIGHEQLTARVIANQDRRCFVASYAIGENHPITDDLRNWRDQYLKKHLLGRIFIAAYYATSPILIRCFGGSRLFKTLSASLVTKLASYITKKD